MSDFGGIWGNPPFHSEHFGHTQGLVTISVYRSRKMGGNEGNGGNYSAPRSIEAERVFWAPLAQMGGSSLVAVSVRGGGPQGGGVSVLRLSATRPHHTPHRLAYKPQPHRPNWATKGRRPSAEHSTTLYIRILLAKRHKAFCSSACHDLITSGCCTAQPSFETKTVFDAAFATQILCDQRLQKFMQLESGPSCSPCPTRWCRCRADECHTRARGRYGCAIRFHFRESVLPKCRGYKRQCLTTH